MQLLPLDLGDPIGQVSKDRMFPDTEDKRASRQIPLYMNKFRDSDKRGTNLLNVLISK